MRKGLGRGLGKGYKNIVPRDPFIHSLSARGVKSYMPMQKIKKLNARGHSKMFQIDKDYYITAWWENTSYGFRHLATLYENGREVETTKATYYNRTWERYEFESVIHSLIRKHFDEKQAEKMIKKLEKKRGTLYAKGRQYELSPSYDPRQSFYGKAQVVQDNGDMTLLSYNTNVAEIKKGKPKVFGYYSQTTMRHIREFLKQNGFKAENPKQILKDYGD